MDLKSLFNSDAIMDAAQGVADQMMATVSEMGVQLLHCSKETPFLYKFFF